MDILVSNPWREAIEGIVAIKWRELWKVSNPWREAIEEGLESIVGKEVLKFPILGGRLLK